MLMTVLMAVPMITKGPTYSYGLTNSQRKATILNQCKSLKSKYSELDQYQRASITPMIKLNQVLTLSDYIEELDCEKIVSNLREQTPYDHILSPLLSTDLFFYQLANKWLDLLQNLKPFFDLVHQFPAHLDKEEVDEQREVEEDHSEMKQYIMSVVKVGVGSSFQKYTELITKQIELLPIRISIMNEILSNVEIEEGGFVDAQFELYDETIKQYFREQVRAVQDVDLKIEPGHIKIHLGEKLLKLINDV
eukprot:NODE_462_length_7167_cov_0.402518.p5 type:complete len:249 gc:universal NODE_462_length_7167_cov_0.402518:6004-5258(-)